MEIREYLFKYRYGVKEFAKKAGIGQTTLFRIIWGTPVSERTARKVNKASNKMVYPKYVIKRRGVKHYEGKPKNVENNESKF